MNHTPNTTDRAHALDIATALTPIENDTFRGATTAAYGNMVGPFGGIISAALINAICIHPRRLGDPVALTVNFAGPVMDGEFTITTKVLRTNRTTQHWYMELAQGDQVGATATAVFATRRDTWAATEVRFPPADAAANIEREAPIFHANWTSAYDMRFAHGRLEIGDDAVERADSLTQVWLRDAPPRALDFVSLTALCDAFFPRILMRRPRRVPVGTVSLTIHFHADAADLALQGDRHVLGTARALHFGKGYFDQTAEIWSDQKTLLATSHQVVYFKE
ncbi:MAG: thioesterase family protein [Herminiimonas sp.]|nr:thioesterase family protein [Herminiimonas sp.]